MTTRNASTYNGQEPLQENVFQFENLRGRLRGRIKPHYISMRVIEVSCILTVVICHVAACQNDTGEPDDKSESEPILSEAIAEAIAEEAIPE